MRTYAPRTPRMASERQIAFIQKLATEQGTTQPTQAQIDTWTTKKASELIEWFLERQKALKAAAPKPAQVE